MDALAIATAVKTAVFASPPDSLARMAWKANQDVACADALNAKTERGPVPIVEVSSYCIRQGITGSIKVALEGSNTPEAVRAVCYATLTLIETDYRLTICDVTDPAFGQVTGGLVAAGIMTTNQQSSLISLANGRLSVIEVALGSGVVVMPTDVEYARTRL